MANRLRIISNHLQFDQFEQERGNEFSIQRSKLSNSIDSNFASIKYSNQNEFQRFGSFIGIQKIEERSKIQRFQSIRPKNQLQNQRPRFANICFFDLKLLEWNENNLKSIIFQRSCYSDRLFSSGKNNEIDNDCDEIVLVVCNEDEPSDFSNLSFFNWNPLTHSIQLKSKVWHCFYSKSKKTNQTTIQCLTYEDQTDADFETFELLLTQH